MTLPHLPLAALLLMLAAGVAQPAGLQRIEVPTGDGAATMAGVVWYPCARPPGEVTVGRLRLSATLDCPLEKSGLPLVVVSHGYGGNFAGHHDTAETLADAGFVVAAINHPIDSTADTSRGDTLAWFTERPRDIGRLIDFMLGAWADRARLDPQRIGFFGFSRGGYTGLVLIGAEPDFRAALPRLCPPSARNGTACGEVRAGADLPTGFMHDPRIKAAVVADPGPSALFTAAAVGGVAAPVQLWASALSGQDQVGVTVEEVERIAASLPGRPDFHLVANAGHFVFLTPCPPALAHDLPRLCADPPGFDRAAFHREFDASVLAFFRAQLMR